ncbi:MAG: error-prone DNA polymerase [Thermoleophilia bacterium]|nr:error-prone DNA polymerase [Thermoleophilia bacterium]
MTSPPYVELHAHSAFSFLDGASMPDELAARAAELGHTAMALTDHDGLSGAMEFAHAATAAGVRPITGAEITVTTAPHPGARHLTVGHGHVTLLVMDARGYANLCRLITISHAHTRDSRDRSAGDPLLPMEALALHHEGLACLSGCARHGVVAAPLAAGRRRDAEQALRDLVAIFGPHRTWVEVQRPGLRGDRVLARALEQLAEHVGVPAVATGDIHAHSPRRAFLQDALVAIRHRLTLDASEEMRRGNRQAVLRTPQEMAARLGEHPGAVAESVRLAEMLSFDLTRDLGYRFPDFVAGHPGEDADGALARICADEARRRYPAGTGRDEALARLDEELGLIRHHGLSGFFLLHRDILEIAREVALEVRPEESARRALPPGRGRGSSVGSIVCYLTGLSHIDPVAGGLFLGRFLNRDIRSVPDIDLDFPRDVRERLIEEIVRRYGTEHAALVAAFPTFRARMAIREIGGALALPPADVERLARLSDGWSSADAVEDEIRRMPGGEDRLRSRRWRALAMLAKEAAGLPRHLAQHSGGMIVSATPLVELVPVVPSAFPGRQICQWDKDSCADAGFVKIDLLGLGMLTAVEDCLDLIASTHGRAPDLSRIGFDDPAVYAEIQDADTVGVFQIESRAQMQSLLQTRPENLDDLTVQVALIRPGPVSGGAVHPYVRHRRARRHDPSFRPPYDHPLLAPVLEETLGVVVFQEQVLEVAMALAGFSAGEAEDLRRAMSRKRSRTAMLQMWQRFLSGARERHVPDEVTRTVFTKLIGFSNFGFPKAHSAAFAVLAYQSAWLRRHHPAEFLAALINSQPMGFYPPASLVRDAGRRGVRTLRTCIHRSQVGCTVEDGAVLLGLRMVRGLGDAAARIVHEREVGGGFAGLADLISRTNLRPEQMATLARAGALDAFDVPEREMLWQIGTLARPRITVAGEQLPLPLDPASAPALPVPDRIDRVLAEYETTGVSTGWHLMTLVRPALPAGTVTAQALRDARHGSTVTVGGMVVARQRPATAGGIVFLLLEDETGAINVIIRPDLYESHRAIVRADPLLVITGRLERRERVVNVLARDIRPARLPARDPVPLEQPVDARVRQVVPAAQDFARGRR